MSFSFNTPHPRLVAFLLIAMIMSACSTLEHHFLYFPQARHDATPLSAGLAYEEVHFKAQDGTRLTGWLVPGRPDFPLVLFCIGNAGNISHRLETLQLLNDLGVSTFIFDYRGYGQSAGKTNELGTYSDVIGAIEMLQDRGWAPKQIIIFGRSLGAAVGLEAALNTEPAGLIMESAFTSIPAMGRFHYPIIGVLFGWLIDAKYDNLGKIGDLKSPLLLLHGTADTICPPYMAEKLYASAPTQTRLHWIEGAGHNNGFVVGGETYKNILKQAIGQWVD